MNIHTINTGLFKLDGGAMHGVVPKSMWQKVNPADENNMCTWAMRCLLIEDGKRLILVDTGMGNKQDEKFFSHFIPHGEDTLQKSIEKLNYSMDDITDVFLTHLHFDHCGGAIRKEQDIYTTSCSNAIYWSTQKHWQSAINPNVREKASFLKENILPIQESGQLQFIEERENTLFTNSIEVKFVQGHTESMMLPLLHYKNNKILFCADLIPSHGHISIPWVMGYDMRPLDTLNEKTKLLQEAVENNWILFFEHDKSIETCTLQQTEKGIRSQQIAMLYEW